MINLRKHNIEFSYKAFEHTRDLFWRKKLVKSINNKYKCQILKLILTSTEIEVENICILTLSHMYDVYDSYIK